MGKNECIKCGKSFSTIATLKSHLNRKTPCDRIMTCVLCNKTFKVKASFDKHKNICRSLKSEHSMEEPKEQKESDDTKEPKEADNEPILIDVFSLMKLGSDAYSRVIRIALSGKLTDEELQITNSLVENIFHECLTYMIAKHAKNTNSGPITDGTTVTINVKSNPI